MMLDNWSQDSLWEGGLPPLGRLGEEINELLQNVRVGVGRPYPALNVWTSERDALVTAELPGADPASLDVAVVGTSLTLRGRRPEDPGSENVVYHRRERGAGEFSRTVELPFRVENEKVQAAFNNGVLRITLPRAEADKPRKIAVKAA